MNDILFGNNNGKVLTKLANRSLKSSKNYIAILAIMLSTLLFTSLFTIAGHFFVLNTPFRTTIYDGSFSLFIQSMANFIFKGTPFFMMLSGFLLSTKAFDKKYYKRGIKVILSYLFFSIITILFRRYYLQEDLSWTKWFLKILDFSAIPYAWYIEMWIGLFLLSGKRMIISKGRVPPKFLSITNKPFLISLPSLK